ncbi:MAG: flagellar protein FlgN, partial [Parafilimonas terrae]|nr:flagellar protein FlgN [Parafilimonas terrae]
MLLSSLSRLEATIDAETAALSVHDLSDQDE